jgi:hypothetical protein
MPILNKYNVLNSEKASIPSPESTCSFCALVGMVFRHFTGHSGAKYTYQAIYDFDDELCLIFSNVENYQHYVQVYISGKPLISNLVGLL